LLQPLVENAVRHGIAKQTGNGRLLIETSRSNGRLSINIADNGPGIDTSAAGNGCGGLGLANTRARLERFFGEYDLKIDGNRSGGGTVVRLDVPYLTL
jgi:sensor histidine kinase YesM